MQSKDELSILKIFKLDHEIILTQKDKSNKSTILNTDDCRNKII